MGHEISKEKIDKFILDLAKTHPETSIENFKIEFKRLSKRGPSHEDIQSFTNTVTGIIDKFIFTTAQTEPEPSVDKFTIEFKNLIKRDPLQKEINAFVNYLHTFKESVNEFMLELAQTNPKIGIEEFKFCFKEVIKRDPLPNEIEIFVKCVEDFKIKIKRFMYELIQTHPEYTEEQFKIEFKSSVKIKRDPFHEETTEFLYFARKVNKFKDTFLSQVNRSPSLGEVKTFLEHIYKYEVENGFLGLKTNTIVKLCGLMWYDKKKIKQVVGMCRTNFLLKENPYFLKGRPHKFDDTFCPNPRGGCVLIHTPHQTRLLQCSFTEDRFRTLFLSTCIGKEGVFRWTVQIRYAVGGFFSQLFVGASPFDRLSQCSNTHLGYTPGSCSLEMWKNGDVLQSWLRGTADTSNFPQGETCVPDGAFVSLEADGSARTLSFFVDERKVPRAVSDVCVPLHLGVSGCTRSSFVSVLFCRLPAPTPSPVTCRYYKSFPKE